MKVNPVVVLGCLALATLITFLGLIALERGRPQLSISILDGSGLSGAEILNAAYFLSPELPVQINFQTSGTSSGSIIAMSRKDASKLPVDAMSLVLRVDEIRLNDVVLTHDQLRSRLAVFAESARLTESDPFLLLAAWDRTSGVQLTRLLQILADSQIPYIIPIHSPEAANQSRVASGDSAA